MGEVVPGGVNEVHDVVLARGGQEVYSVGIQTGVVVQKGRKES